MPHQNQHRNPQLAGETMHVDHIETADGDALEHHRPNLATELTVTDQVDHSARSVGPIALDVAAHDTIEPRPRADSTDEEHFAAVIAREGPVVETNDVHDSFVSSILAMASRCTSSGPSARRRVRVWAHALASGKSPDTPAPPMA